jgi:hypothetical protein
MLDPHDRASLYEALRPPAGYDLDCAVGTSFTLDLEALLTAPTAVSEVRASCKANAIGAVSSASRSRVNEVPTAQSRS